MDKLKMSSENLIGRNIERIAELFPNCITEISEDGEGKRMIDFDILRQELSGTLVEGKDERYRLDWSGKRKAILTANSPIAKTLRPCREESVDFDNTENLYIEGDNLDVLKVLHETYLNKVKMIYIDPPYNTGNDFVYNDDFTEDSEEYLINSNQQDDQGNRLTANKDTSGRYHSDWLSMMYMRLKLARDLLADDGVIFISIDDNEVDNLMKISTEVFGESNFVGQFIWVKKKKGSHLSKTIRSMTEYVLCYSKNIINVELFGEAAYSDKQQPIVKRTNSIKSLVFPINTVKTTLSNGNYCKDTYGEGTSAVKFCSDFIVMDSLVITEIEVVAPFVWTQSKLDDEIRLGSEVNLSSKFGFNVLRYNQSEKIKRPSTLIDSKLGVGTNEDAYSEAISIFGKEGIMSYPKPTTLLKYLINTITYFDKDAVILDFFSGSATTAHAVMQLNAEDGGNRKFICVQLEEYTYETKKDNCKNEKGEELKDEKGKVIKKLVFDEMTGYPEIVKDSEARKAGYWTIPQIGKERIRRVGTKIKNESPLTTASLDTGFRVLKLDDSNMREVYYNPNEYTQDLITNLESSIKDGRTAEDVLFQIMLDKGVLLSSQIQLKSTLTGGQKYYVVGKTDFDKIDLICCLDDKIDTEAVKELAKLLPECCVFLDSSMESDATRTNVEQIFKTYSPNTTVEVI